MSIFLKVIYYFESLENVFKKKKKTVSERTDSHHQTEFDTNE